MEVIGQQHALVALSPWAQHHWCFWNMKKILLMPELVWMLWTRNKSLPSKEICTILPQLSRL